MAFPGSLRLCRNAEGLRADTWYYRVLIAALVAYSLLLGAQAAWDSPVVDEVGHLVAGLSHWYHGRFDLYRVNPPLVRMVAALPVLLARPKTVWQPFSESPHARYEFVLGPKFAEENGARTFWLFTLGRWACIPLSLVGIVVCCEWSGQLFGRSASYVALVLACGCPNLLAHGHLLTPDAPAASMGILASYLFWRWLQKPTIRKACWTGLALGICELTKTTWSTLFLLWPAICLYWSCTTWPAACLEWRARLKEVAVILGLGLTVLNCGYLWEGTFTRIGDYRFVSGALTGGTPQPEVRIGNRFATSIIGAIPVPLPRNYVMGIDYQKFEFERTK